MPQFGQMTQQLGMRTKMKRNIIFLIGALLIVSVWAYAAQQTVPAGNGVITVGTVRGYINDNFTELYGKWTSLGATHDTGAELDALYLQDSEVTNLADVKAFDPTDYATAAQGATADTAHQPGDTLQTSASTTLPATCTVGQIHTDTNADTDGSLYICVATNTWKEVDDDGGTGGGDVSAVNTPVANDIARFTTATSIEGLSYAELVAILQGQNWSPTGSWDFSAASSVTFGPVSAICFEGATADAYETCFSITDPTADNLIYLGNYAMRVPASSAINADGTIADSGIDSTIARDTETAAAVDAIVYSKCITIAAADSDSDFMVESFTGAITITNLSLNQLGATNVVGQFDECDSAGGTCVAIDTTDLTATTTKASDASPTNAAIDAGDVIAWRTTSVSGTNTQMMACFEYTVD